jgi:glycosyltransferase involved in cell wall biosynthesis
MVQGREEEVVVASGKLKILYHHRIGSRDGQAIHMANMTGSFRDLGHEVIVVGPPVLHALDSGGTLPLVRLLKRYLPQSLFELIELLHAVPSYFVLLWTYFRYRPDVLYERFSLFQLAGAWLRKTVGIPMFLEVNSPLFLERAEVDGLRSKRLGAWCEKYIMSSADLLLPVSDVLAGMLRDMGFAERKIEVVHNGVDTKQFVPHGDPETARKALGYRDEIVIGFTAYVRDWHRLEAVLEVLADSREENRHRLLIIGDGPGIAPLMEQAEVLGIAGMIEHTGSIPHDKLPAYLAAVDIAVQPGVTPYASPLKLFEYMAMARAIVAPDQANIREIVEDQVSSLLFDPEDPEAFKQTVHRLCADKPLRDRLGQAALARLHDKGFYWQNNAHRVAEMAVRFAQV